MNKHSNLENESNSQAVALFKYSVISPLVHGFDECKSKEDFYRKAAQKEYELPNGKKTYFTPNTIKSWYIKYQTNGLEALKQKKRTDIGKSRKIPEEFVIKIAEIKEQYPHLTGKGIYTKLLESNQILAKDVSLSTIYRFLNNNNLHQRFTTERKAFEMESANDCWQGDTSHGPILTIDGKKIQTYLIQLIDDASRLIIGYKFFFKDNALNFQHVLKQAIKIYGVPKKIFVDNGTPYKNQQLQSICASLRNCSNTRKAVFSAKQSEN